MAVYGSEATSSPTTGSRMRTGIKTNRHSTVLRVESAPSANDATVVAETSAIDADATIAPPTPVGGAKGSTTRPSPSRLRHQLIAADAAAIAIGIMATFVLQAMVRPVPHWIQAEHLLLACVAAPIWMLTIGANKLYMARVVERPADELRLLLVSGTVAVGAMVAVAFALQYRDLSRLWIVSMFTLVTVALVTERRISRRVFATLRASGRINRRVAIIGTDAHAIGLLHTVERNPGLGYEVVGFVGADDLGQREGKVVLGAIRDANEILRSHECSGALISLNSVQPNQVNRLTRELTDDGFHVALSTSLRDIDVTRMRPQTLDGQTLIYVEPTIRTGWRGSAKRAFDVAIASIGVVLTAPFVGVAVVLIRLESEGPVFFRQQRVGLDGRPFEIIKLRTMYLDAEERKAELMAQNEMDGPLFKMAHDPRITKVGRILRKLSIDEFPQFWNVIRGEMSAVGPRPALPDEVAQWDAELHDRLRVLPGITGMWQVSGRSDTSFDDYKRLDLYYVDNWSLYHDVCIVAKTFGAVLLSRGAS